MEIWNEQHLLFYDVLNFKMIDVQANKNLKEMALSNLKRLKFI
jgi:hypothetical protein